MLFSQLIKADSVLLYFEGNYSFHFTVVFNYTFWNCRAKNILNKPRERYEVETKEFNFLTLVPIYP